MFWIALQIQITLRNLLSWPRVRLRSIFPNLQIMRINNTFWKVAESKTSFGKHLRNFSYCSVSMGLTLECLKGKSSAPSLHISNTERCWKNIIVVSDSKIIFGLEMKFGDIKIFSFR